MQSNYHQQRLCGLTILRFKLDKALKDNDAETISLIWNTYMDNLDAVDHWDLVDESGDSILGRILVHNAIEAVGQVAFKARVDFKDPANGFPTLARLAYNDNIWHKRISIVSGFTFIKNHNLKLPLSVCAHHIDNKHHYIQKATGWVLREIGKHDKDLLDQFLKDHIQSIHSICLSYALEKHTKEEKVIIRSMRAGKKR